MLLCLYCTTALGDIIYVDADTPANNDGSSWGNAYKFLQDALNTATTGDEIWVAEGIYRPDETTANPEGTGNRFATFQLKNDVAVYGGFPAGGGTWEQRAPSIYETVLSGDLNSDDGPEFANNGENSYHVVTGSEIYDSAVLDGFTIMAGNANGASSPETLGGGMYNSNSNLLVTNCTFTGNSATWDGGGMNNTQSDYLTVTNCTFTGNLASRHGGGMRNDSDTTVTNCTFTGNSAADSGGGMVNVSEPTVMNCTFTSNSARDGGGMCNYGGPTVTNCTFTGNSATSDGGGMCNLWNEIPTVMDCKFIDNSAGCGGGMYNDGTSGYSAIANCAFTGNSAYYGGGLFNKHIWWPQTLTNCTFTGNSAAGDGGGIYNYETFGDYALANCVFTGNSAAYYGGGMYSYDNDPELTNCTFSGNSAEYGGGMVNYEYNANVTNCIFWGNAASFGSQIFDPLGIVNYSVNYSCVQDWDGSLGGVGNFGLDPLFADPENGDVHLKSKGGRWDPSANNGIGGWVIDMVHSPCIDTGDPSYPSGDEPEINGDRINMGAYGGTEFASKSEFANTPPVADADGPYIEWATGWYGALVSLSGTFSYDPDEDILTYEWDLDLAVDSDLDGNPANDVDSTEPSPIAEFPIGLTEISLIVIDECGAVSQPDVTTVTVSVIEVSVEIRSDDGTDTINMGSEGVVRVVFITDDLFDALTVDPLTVTLRGEDFADGIVKFRGKNEDVPMTEIQDFDFDGDLDFVVNLDTERLAEYELDALCEVAALTYDGYVVDAVDTVRIVPEEGLE
jgi:hypothetical protein